MEKRMTIDDSDLFRAGKHAVEDCREVNVRIAGDSAEVEAIGHDSKVRKRKMSVFAWQTFSTGYTIRLAELKRIA